MSLLISLLTMGRHASVIEIFGDTHSKFRFCRRGDSRLVYEENVVHMRPHSGKHLAGQTEFLDIAAADVLSVRCRHQGYFLSVLLDR